MQAVRDGQYFTENLSWGECERQLVIAAESINTWLDRLQPRQAFNISVNGLKRGAGDRVVDEAVFYRFCQKHSDKIEQLLKGLPANSSYHAAAAHAAARYRRDQAQTFLRWALLFASVSLLLGFIGAGVVGWQMFEESLGLLAVLRAHMTLQVLFFATVISLTISVILWVFVYKALQHQRSTQQQFLAVQPKFELGAETLGQAEIESWLASHNPGCGMSANYQLVRRTVAYLVNALPAAHAQIEAYASTLARTGEPGRTRHVLLAELVDGRVRVAQRGQAAARHAILAGLGVGVLGCLVAVWRAELLPIPATLAQALAADGWFMGICWGLVAVAGALVLLGLTYAVATRHVSNCQAARLRVDIQRHFTKDLSDAYLKIWASPLTSSKIPRFNLINVRSGSKTRELLKGIVPWLCDHYPNVMEHVFSQARQDHGRHDYGKTILKAGYRHQASRAHDVFTRWFLASVLTSFVTVGLCAGLLVHTGDLSSSFVGALGSDWLSLGLFVGTCVTLLLAVGFGAMAMERYGDFRSDLRGLQDTERDRAELKESSRRLGESSRRLLVVETKLKKQEAANEKQQAGVAELASLASAVAGMGAGAGSGSAQ